MDEAIGGGPDPQHESNTPETPPEEEPQRDGRRGWGSTLAAILVLAGIVLATIGVVEYRTRGASAISGDTVAARLLKAQANEGEAPAIDLPAVEGPPVSLDAFRGYVVVVNFWASWCGPCRQEAPGLRRVSEDYVRRGVRFLGVDERDDRPAASGFLREFGITYPSAFDPAGSLADDYQLDGLPSTFVIDPAGQIRYRFFGYLDEATLRGALDRLTAKQPPAPTAGVGS